MKVLAFAHHLEIGGSQVNAVDVAGEMVARGHQVDVFATPGQAAQLVRDRGLRLVEAPRPRTSPSPAVARALSRHLAAHRYDWVHAWDWPQCLDAYAAARLRRRVPVIGSIMSMVVTRTVPRSMPLTYGTEELVAAARARGYRTVHLMEPPVNIEQDGAGERLAGAFRRDVGSEDGDVLVVVVSRLVGWLKLEGIRAAIRAVDELARRWRPGAPRARLVVVGGGSAEPEVRRLAAGVVSPDGRPTVTVTGALEDPRPAYAGADVVLGMGGSVLRGMAFGRPAVVLGEGGFADVFDEDSAAGFAYRGLYGLGAGADLTDRLLELLPALVDDSGRRRRLGAWSQRTVRQRYGLPGVTERFEQFVTTQGLAASVAPPPWEPFEVLARRVASPLARSARRLSPALPAPDRTTTGAAR